jgi:hypothetical protein
MVRACTPKWRFACLREAASAKAGHAGVDALWAWAINFELRIQGLRNLKI